jgi:hypothetical protein
MVDFNYSKTYFSTRYLNVAFPEGVPNFIVTPSSLSVTNDNVIFD